MRISIRIVTALALFGTSILITPSASAWSSGTNIAINVIGGTSREQAIWMALDSNGNTYTAGYFQATVDFDPSDGIANLTSAGFNDMFISKFDPSGNYLWAKRIGGTGSESIASIAVDRYGNIFATGDLVGTVDFDPGDGIANLTSVGGGDGFVLKLDTNGNFVWAKQFGSPGFDKGVFIAVDGDGNVAITGTFSETVDFNPGAGTANLTATADWDIFILKLDSSGNYLWANRRGGPGREVGDGIAFDNSGNIYASGYFNGTVDFDPSDAVSNLTSAGSTDIFISKFDSSGNYQWAKRIGGTSNDYINPIGMDSSGNIFVSGIFKNTVDFDPGDATANLTSAGGYDIFISKFDSSGNYQWVKRIGGLSDDTTWSIASDRNGNIVTAGKFAGTADFDPGTGTANLTPAGNNDIFISKLDSSGNYLWAKQIGGPGDDGGQPIAFDSSGNIYASGYFSNTVDFDPGAGTSNFISNGDYDIFTLKLDSSGNVPLVAVVSSGTAPNSKVATIPSGVTEAAIAATSALPAIKLNFGGTVPAAVTVVPLASNPASQSATPFSFSSSTKIVDIQLSGSISGSVTLCLDGASTDRLYHYKESAWVELGSRSYVNGQVCGVTTSFSPFVAAPAIVPVYVAPTPVPYLKTLTSPKLNLKDGNLVCTSGTYNAGYTLDGVIQGSPTAAFSPSSYTYNLLINGVAQTPKVVTSASTSTTWELQAIPSGSLVVCSVTVSANSLTNTDKSSDNTAAVSSALNTQSQAIKAAEATYSESVSASSKAYQKALVDNRATWRKEIEVIQSGYNETLNRIKAKGGPKASSETSAALKLRIAASKKSAADYAASKPAALATKDAANKAALDVKSAAITKANLNYGTFIESIGYGVLVP